MESEPWRGWGEKPDCVVLSSWLLVFSELSLRSWQSFYTGKHFNVELQPLLQGDCCSGKSSSEITIVFQTFIHFVLHGKVEKSYKTVMRIFFSEWYSCCLNWIDYYQDMEVKCNIYCMHQTTASSEEIIARIMPNLFKFMRSFTVFITKQ